MRMLLIHADKFDYEVKSKAIPEPEEPKSLKASVENALIAFCTIEKNDEINPKVIAFKASEHIIDVFNKVKAESIVIYPYAHLSSDLASKEAAIPILEEIEEKIEGEGFKVYRSPFGWYKSFNLSCKGHPLSELSRTIIAEKEEAAVEIKTEYAIMDLEGNLHNPIEYNYKLEEAELKALVEKEALKKELFGGKPKFLDYCSKFGVEWESYSDIGHMRYEPEGSLIFDLISEYAWQVANSLEIPIFSVKGTNMFNIAEPPVKEHAKLFGEKLYEIKADEKTLILRYAACHQQFAMVKDWVISHKQMPFGTFEVADSYRLEKSGELLLCFRVRKLHMPDLHVYCKDLENAKEISLKIHEKIYNEIRKLGREYVSIYNVTRKFFEENKSFFLKLLSIEKKPVLINFVPEGRFYWVINVEYTIIDELNRPREIATFQIDVGNSKRFGIHYIDENGRKIYPPIIHTALIGTVERYLFTLLDSASKKERKGLKPSLPLWLSPIQVRLIPVNQSYLLHALKLAEKLKLASIRVDVDDREDSVSKKVLFAEKEWIPYILVIGKKEVKTGKLNIRVREEGKQKSISIKDLILEVKNKTEGYPFKPLNMPMLLSKRPVYKMIK
ncbi:MAG: threonine--tRNA ligase [Candidatus Bathyarchaeia archaeon]